MGLWGSYVTLYLVGVFIRVGDQKLRSDICVFEPVFKRYVTDSDVTVTYI